MDFFETQKDSRRESMILLAAFAAVFIICFLFVHWLASGVATVLHAMTPALHHKLTTWLLICPIALVIMIGCYTRWRDVSSGGHQLAMRLGAMPMTRNAEHRSQSQLLNIVEEISIAASITAPASYVLKNESSINAFVAGTSDCTVLVVTQGALDKLSEQEMRAVVAHEIAHIDNNDLSLSMKLLVALGGLNAITEAGHACFKRARVKRNDDPFARSMSSQNSAALSVVFVIMGVFLYLLGGVFTFFGDVLKAAFSRKRELLADAKAVQYTRNTWGIASALDKIAKNKQRIGLHSKYSSEIAHMCIDAPSLHFLFPKSLATHPALDTRISAIEPHFQVKSRKRERPADEASKHPTNGVARTVIGSDVSNALSTRTMSDCLPELAILIAMMVQTSGNNADKNAIKYQSTLKCYTNKTIPMHSADAPNSEAELERALDCLLQLPANQRQNLTDHLAELAEHDGVHMEAEVNLLEHIYSRLNPDSKAA